MSDGDDVVVRCVPVDAHAGPVDGSVRRVCADCGCAVWIDGEIVETHGESLRVLCWSCGPMPTEVRIMPAQYVALAASGATDAQIAMTLAVTQVQFGRGIGGLPDVGAVLAWVKSEPGHLEEFRRIYARALAHVANLKRRN